MNQPKLIRFAAAIGALALVAAACGGSKKTETGSGGDETGNKSKTLSAAPGFDPATNTIKVGVITPLTGQVGVIGVPLTAGGETWFRYINEEKGGIAGKYKVELVKEDSQYKPDLGVQAYNKIKGNVALIGQLLGTGVTKAVLPLLKQDNMVAAPASLDADWVAERNLLPVGGPYQIQMINAASYLVQDKGMKSSTFCTAIQNDPYGLAGQQGVEYAAKELGFTIKTTAKWEVGNPDFTAPVQQLKSSGCQVVFLVSTPSDTSKIMATSAQLQFAPQWVGQSPTWTGSFVKSPLAPYLQQHFLLVSEGTEWGDTSVKGMSDMLDRLQKYTPGQQPDIYFVFGYYQAKAVTALLEKAVADGDLSRAGLLKALDSLGTQTFEGLTADYDYGTTAGKRNPPRASTIYSVDPNKPGGLAKAKYLFESDAAKKFTFAGASGM